MPPRIVRYLSYVTRLLVGLKTACHEDNKILQHSVSKWNICSIQYTFFEISYVRLVGVFKSSLQLGNMGSRHQANSQN